jgi:hypothetical protein
VQSAGYDQALDDTDVLRAEFGPAEKPGSAAHGNHTQCPLQVVRIDGHIRVGKENLEADATLAHIVQRLDKRIGRREALAL